MMPNDSKILTDQSDESDKARSWTNNGKKNWACENKGLKPNWL